MPYNRTVNVKYLMGFLRTENLKVLTPEYFGKWYALIEQAEIDGFDIVVIKVPKATVGVELIEKTLQNVFG